MHAVEARDHEEARAELRRAERILPGSHALHDQFGPLECLHADKRGAQGRGRRHEPEGCFLRLAVAHVDGQGHSAG